MNENALVQQEEKMATVLSMFRRPAVQKQLQMVCGRYLPPEKVVRITQTALRQTPDLLYCTPGSLLACLMASATLGLEIEPFLGQAYMVPFKNRRANIIEATFIVGYRGLLTLARRSGEVLSVQTGSVHESDLFEFEKGLDEKLRHVPSGAHSDFSKLAGFTHFYVLVRYKGGGHSWEVMTRDEVEYVRDTYSRGKDADAWGKRPTEMAIKTVIRKHFKQVPLASEINLAMALDDARISEVSQASLLNLEMPDAPAAGYMAPDQPAAGGPPGVDDFNRAVAAGVAAGEIDPAALDEFLVAVAANSRMNTDQVKREAAGSMADFLKTFRRWNDGRKSGAQGQAAAGAGKAPQAGGASDPIAVDKWRSMRSGSDPNGKTTGFGAFVHAMADHFRAAGSEVQQLAREKWAKLYPQADFPLDAKEGAKKAQEGAPAGGADCHTPGAASPSTAEGAQQAPSEQAEGGPDGPEAPGDDMRAALVEELKEARNDFPTLFHKARMGLAMGMDVLVAASIDQLIDLRDSMQILAKAEGKSLKF